MRERGRECVREVSDTESSIVRCDFGFALLNITKVFFYE